MKTEKLLVDGKSFTIEYEEDNVVKVTRDADGVEGEVEYIGRDECNNEEFVFNVHFEDGDRFALGCWEAADGNIEEESFYYGDLIDPPAGWDEDELDKEFAYF